ncbi:MAG: HD domain-containing protein [Deltaproteobacteria bacterium]|nr:HD domain-containing protein [Deltaproteobacteria bacterium]
MANDKGKNIDPASVLQYLTLSDDKNLNRLLGSVITEVKGYADILISQIKRLSEIGIALSAERDLDKLLEMIVDEARRFTNADAGTLYIREGAVLKFKILQNDTLKTRLGGTSGNPITLPPVEMKETNVSAYVAIKAVSVNIPDVYDSVLFDFTGPKKFDEATGYRSRSMLVVPMKNHESDIIGVLQLLNAKEIKTNTVVQFSKDFELLIESLASQAAVAVTNVMLIRDIENLFESFVMSMAAAIDAKSPYNVSHTKRVAGLTLAVAETINAKNDGPFKDVRFTPEELNELRMAGWLHDIGKITTPEWVVNKGTKLEKIIDRIELVKTRFAHISGLKRIAALSKKVALLSSKNSSSAAELESIDKELEADIAQLRDDLEFIEKSNRPGEFMEDDKLARLYKIAGQTFVEDNVERPYLEKDELKNLSIRKGSITEEERLIMQDHVSVTAKMLREIPFIKKLKNAPKYASEHHECMNGKGYPKGLKAEELDIRSRILALVDFCEALTAKDRPYKKAMPLEVAFKIMGSAANDGHLDKELFALFVEEKVYERYEKAFEGEKK